MSSILAGYHVIELNEDTQITRSRSIPVDRQRVFSTGDDGHTGEFGGRVEGNNRVAVGEVSDRFTTKDAVSHRTDINHELLISQLVQAGRYVLVHATRPKRTSLEIGRSTQNENTCYR